MTDELKPCPFCGSPARLNRSTGESLWSHDQVEWTQVQCTNEDCGVATENHCEGWEPTPIESWNSRALSASQPAQAGEACSDCDGKGYTDSWTADGEYNPTHCESCDGGRKPAPEPDVARLVASIKDDAKHAAYMAEIDNTDSRDNYLHKLALSLDDLASRVHQQATPEPSHAAKMLKADVAYVEQQMAAATPEPEWETTPKDGEQWETSPKEATTEPVGEARCSTCGVTMNEPHHPACGAVTAAIIGLNTMAAQDKEARRRELAEKIRETLRGVFTHPAPGVPEIDYQALIHAAWGKHKYAQGTGGCIAFKRGAEWFRDIALAAAQAKGGQ